MTAILDALELPADGPIYFGELVPFKGGIGKVTTEALAVYHAAEYLAHIRIYDEALHTFIRSGLPGDEPSEAVEAFRSALRDHFDPSITAWTAAAALKGWDGPKIGEALDMGDSLEEWAWEWLGEWLSAPGDEIDDKVLSDLFDRLTPVPQRTVAEGQMVIKFGAAAGGAG